MTQPHKIKVGLLIPTFNRKAYLAEALHSSRSQTYDNIEIIVIDNGSTDGTAEFMKTIPDSRILYVMNEQNLGMIGSINKGVNLFSSEVEWCTILSDDDVLDNDFIAKLVHTVVIPMLKVLFIPIGYSSIRAEIESGKLLFLLKRKQLLITCICVPIPREKHTLPE